MDDFYFPAWNTWKHVEVVSITQAACLLTGHDPSRGSRNRVLPGEADAMAMAIEQAILLRRLPPFAAWTYDREYGESVAVAATELSPHLHLDRDSTIRIEDLAAWCDLKGIDHGWPTPRAASHNERSSPDLSRFPIELRTAVEAFEAVSAKRAVLTKSPRAALLDWLEANKPEIGSNARERIATVANWQPAGGAPKTPAG